MKHDIDFRIFVLTIDNAGNNGTFYRHLIDFLPDTQYINLFDIGKNEFIQFLQHVFCMAHIVQLALKKLLGRIRVSPTNEKFQKNWVDEKKTGISAKNSRFTNDIRQNTKFYNHYCNHFFAD